MRPAQGAALSRRPVITSFIFTVSLFMIGCMGLTGSRRPAAPVQQAYIDRTPTAHELVAYLNANAGRLRSLDSHDLDLDVQAGKQSFGLRGTLLCQKPKNFRLQAKMPALSKTVADFGSNDQEFWYWIEQDRPPFLYHCAYADLERGNVVLPFPLRPDWVLEALGLGAPAPVGTPEQEQARGRTLTVRMRPDKRHVDLIERTTSPQGQPVVKLTVFNNFNAEGTTPQVAEYLLYDAQNQQQPLCRARVEKVHYDAASQAVVPEKMRIEWPSQQLALTLTLGEIQVNNPKTDYAFNKKLFTRPQLRGVREHDLARGLPSMTPAGIQRAGFR
jgi:hypothetical protein